MTARFVDIVERSTKTLPYETPPVSVRAQLNRALDGRVKLTWLADEQVRVETTQWVGVVGLPDGRVLRIVPKLAGGSLNVIAMIGLVSGLDISDLRWLSRGLETKTGDNARTLLEKLLVSAAHDILVGGPMQSYREASEDLGFLRGRLDLTRQVSRHFNRIDRLACEFDEFDHDVIENQVIAAALRIVVQRTDDKDLKLRAHLLAEDFEALAPTPIGPADVARRSIVYHRGNDHYRAAHVWSFALLGDARLDDLFHGGGDRTSAFLINMDRLFERFVGWLLDEAFQESHAAIHPQRRKNTILRSNGKQWKSIRPDYLVELGTERVAVDAKYKRYKSNKISVSDAYQLLIYAQAFPRGTTRPTSLLVYPHDKSLEHGTVDLQPDGATIASISILGVPLQALLDELRSESRSVRDRVSADIRGVLPSMARFGVSDGSLNGLPSRHL